MSRAAEWVARLPGKSFVAAGYVSRAVAARGFLQLQGKLLVWREGSPELQVRRCRVSQSALRGKSVGVAG